MRQNLKTKKPMDKVAVSLVLCFSVVALASVFTVKSSLDKINSSNQDGNTDPQSDFIQEQLVDKKVPTVDSKANENGQSNAETSKVSKWISPVQGSLGMEYSADVPVYSKTLNQYMVHTGLDIKAPLDSRVQAAAAGTVIEAAQTDLLGYVVKINHGDGFVTTYANLSENGLVEAGTVVKQGEIIGGIGDTAMFESLEEPHLHFEMEKDGQSVNPAEYINF